MRQMKKSLKTLLDSGIAALLGIMLTFAFAPYEVFPLAVIAPAGLLALWLRHSTSLRQSFWLGFCFGLGFFGSGVYWVFTSIHVFGGVPTSLAVLITAGLIAFIALYPAGVGYCLNRFFPDAHPTKLLCAFPAIWVLSEWFRGWLFTGFPWLFIGYSQTNSPLKGYAPILSVYLISFALTVSSGLLVNAVIQYRKKAYLNLYKNCFALMLIWVVGSLLTLIPWTVPSGKPISVALVQGNIPQSIKWSPEHLQLSLNRYVEMTDPLWGKYQLIIWPEASVPVPLQNAADFIQSLDDKAVATHTALFLGIPVHTPDDKGYYNSIITLGANKTAYSKRHLVPFGEYIPLTNLLSRALEFMDIPMSDMVPGQLTQSPLIAENTLILPSICYEIAFPQLTRDTNKNIGMLLVVTNDAWFGDSTAEPQHLQMAAMRAIEFGRPLLFVSNDGITAIINPDGTIEKAAPQREITVLTGSVQPMKGITPWLTNGADPILLLAIVLLLVARRAKKNISTKHPIK